MKTVKYPHIKVELIGRDGNAFIILAKCKQAMQRSEISTDEIAEFVKEAMSGDYSHLLNTCMKWVCVS